MVFLDHIFFILFQFSFSGSGRFPDSSDTQMMSDSSTENLDRRVTDFTRMIEESQLRIPLFHKAVSMTRNAEKHREMNGYLGN